ncbi:MAG: hypothetical protein ACTSR8_06600 [Promethearchaeota archaeon]
MNAKASKFNILKNLNNYLNPKNSSLIALPLNLASIVFGILFIAIGDYNIFWDLFGVILLATIFNNLLLMHLAGSKINNVNRLGRIMNRLIYINLIFTVIAFIGILTGNFIISAIYSNNNAGIYSLVYLWYFGFMISGFLFALIIFKSIDKDNLWSVENNGKTVIKAKSSNKLRIPKLLLKIICSLTFLFGLYSALAILLGLYIDIFVLTTAISGMLGIYFSIFIFTNTLILLKLVNKEKKPKKYKKIAIIGFFCSFILLIPLFATPSAYYIAERNFSLAFGNDWREKIPDEIEQNYFLQSPFSTPQYILGIPPKECEIEKDIKFYEDDDIKLFFDVYMPLDDPKDLPGEGSMLIRLHGGGWVMNDKGAGNMLQMNKYFAAQGYIVFDIQYLQYDIGYSMPNTPEYLIGDYTLDEIVASLGFFTKYIAEHSENYDVNLDSVFVSGGSAGGHLTCALALGIASGKYNNLFGTNLTIKGLIPYYPANGMMKYFGIQVEDKDLANPENLIDKNSPPCLIFQGTHDILSSWFHIAENIRNAYIRENNEECAIIWMPCGGHASDFYFTGYYNLLFTYYMERFMYIYH